MLEGGITLESLFEAPPSVQDIGFEDLAPRFPEERQDLKCGECQALMVLRYSSKYERPFYGCSRFPECRGTHGAHKNGAPLGIPADKETKKARIKAHAAFDQIWKGHHVRNRFLAYSWMRKAMGLTDSTAHISMLTIPQCEELVRLVYRDFPQLKGRLERLLYDADPFDDDEEDPALP